MAHKTTEQFIEESRKVHGDKYNYSKTKYTLAHQKIVIICPIHGEFEQKSINHLRGHGCPKCSGNIKLTTEQFIEEARKVHGDKYNYSKIRYNDSKTKITIICPEHGEFEQTPNNHLRSQGCAKCSIIERSNKKGGSTKEFIQKAREVHGDKYDYSKVKYINSNTKITIICPEHGEFKQIPSSHLQGNECKKCGYKKRPIRNKLNQEQVIQKFKKIYGDKYNYSKIKYVDAHTSVIVICPKHGEFLVKPYVHWQQQGKCKKCRGILETTKDFINISKEKFNNNFDYTKTKYINKNTDLIITCLIHGDIVVKPILHLKSQTGCPKCMNRNWNTKDFIIVAEKVFPNQFNYSKTKYINHNEKITIICLEHGEFNITPTHFFRNKHGCPKCAVVNRAKTHEINKEDFIFRAKEKFNDKFDFSNLIYIGYQVETKFMCPEHGEFKITPHDFIRKKYGCPKCAGYGFDYLSLNEAKKIVHKLKLKSHTDYIRWWNKNKKYAQKIGLPQYPDRYYNKK